MKELTGKTILITGGTGSFGKTVVRKLLDTDVGEIRVFSRDELKQELMRIELDSSKVRFYIGDVRDRDSVDNAMKGVDFVFHAAALKQVPSCEFFPMQAVLTNVVGSHNVVEAAINHSVASVVCLGTDKAVYPVNTMGMSKAIMEKVAQAAARSWSSRNTVVSCVRYGNVMCSRGSVIPLFIKQMTEKQPMTITVPHMTRFLLPLEQAVGLVLFAFNNAQPGDLFIRKAPASTIQDLATALKTLFKSDAPIKIIGMRHGEKIYETLATREELQRSDDMGDYYRIRLDDRNLNYTKYFTEGDTEEASVDDYTSHNTRQLSLKELEELLLSLPAVCQEMPDSN